MKIRRKLKHTRPTPEGGYRTEELEVECSPEDLGLLCIEEGPMTKAMLEKLRETSGKVMLRVDNTIMRFIAKRMPGAFDVDAIKKLIAEKEALGL